MNTGRLLLWGSLAGAARTTALNLVTYLDVAIRARPGSSAPEDSVEALANKAGVEIPGDDDAKQNRLSGLGPLTGIVVGIGVGTLLGASRAIGIRPPLLVTALVSTAAAMIGSDAPLTLLKLTDPRTWKPADWAADIIPHFAYGLTTAGTLHALDTPTTR